MTAPRAAPITEPQPPVNKAPPITTEMIASNSLRIPRFIVRDTKGPDHEKVFKVEVNIGSFTHASASAPTKKAAEQIASEKTLESIKPS